MFVSSEEILELLAEQERVAVRVLEAVGAWNAAREWAADASANATSWLVHHADLSSVEAQRLVRNAKLVHTHDQTAAALRGGRIKTGHVDAMARAAREREACFDQHEPVLLDAASTLGVQQFKKVARRWQTLADDAASDDDANESFDGRYLHASITFHGSVRLDGLLDPVGGERVLAALEALMGTDASSSASQRRADALVQLAGGVDVEVNVDMLVDAETLAGDPVDDLARARNDLRRTGPVGRSTIRRLTCDCNLGRIVRRGRSEVLDVGRRHRLVNRAQRRALEARDGGCAFPGCDRPATWTDAHHLVHWVDGGRTDLANLVLLCRLHHTRCHEGGWTLRRAADGTLVAIPPSTAPRRVRGPTPRRAPDECREQVGVRTATADATAWAEPP
jgi:hypothetical protein